MSIPIISPIELTIPSYSAKLLPAPESVHEVLALDEPDYTIQDVEPPPHFIASPALMALNEMEHALEISEYHDFGWWRKHLDVIRTAVKQPRPVDVPVAPPETAAPSTSSDVNIAPDVNAASDAGTAPHVNTASTTSTTSTTSTAATSSASAEPLELFETFESVETLELFETPKPVESVGPVEPLAPLESSEQSEPSIPDDDRT